MFKFKTYKILLLLMLFTFAVNDAWAGKYWYYSCIELRCTPSGAGKVYASTDQTKAQNPNNCVITTDGLDGNAYQTSGRTYRGNRPYKWFVNTVPSNSQQYRFIKWVDQNGNDVSTDQAPQNSFNDDDCAVGLDPNEKKSDASGDPIDDYPTIIYTAVYERIVNQYVAVESQDAGHLTATIDKPENQIGEEVTLWAYPNNYDTKFTGWYKDGELVSMENPWTFIIDQDNAGTYSATCKTDYKFFRIKNKGTLRKFNAINDQGSIDDFSALQLVSGDVATYSPGSVVEISTYHVSGGEVYDYKMQNAQTSSHYTVSEGKYMTMALNSEDNTWIIHPNRQAAYMADEGGSNVTAYGAIENDIAHWYIEPMDKDLETKENYFSLDPNPNKLIEVDGKYYTTLRTSWNILFNPEQMTPYIVKSVDETAGTFEMEAITGNIIPAGTPVIIETKSTDIEENRMVPTLTNAASGAVPSGNLLQHSEKYFPNQPAPVSNCKGLYKNADGQLAFGGNALSTVNGNEAYLSVANEVAKIETLPLSEIEQVGVKNRKYIVEDLLIAVAYAEDTEGSSFLWCKDQGDKSIFATTIHDGKQIDFLLNDENAQNGLPWDQSNWVALKFTGLTTNEADVIRGYVNSYINEKAITGELVDDNNYMLNISAKTLATTAGASYSKNVYCTSNFVLGNLNIFGSIENGDGGYTSGNSAQNYFFMNPKVQEVCKIIYARWDAENNCFTVPITSGFAGNVSVNLAYNEIPNLDLSTALTDKKIYQFEAIVNRASKTAYEAKANRAGEFIVYPLNLTGGNENDPPTAISIVSVNREVVDVEYVNCMGVVSKHPFSGVNIVVTRYSDGSRTTVKMMK